MGLRQDADPPQRPSSSSPLLLLNELSYSICLWSSTLSLAASALPFAGWESVCGAMGLGRSARPARHRSTELTGKAEEEEEEGGGAVQTGRRRGGD